MRVDAQILLFSLASPSPQITNLESTLLNSALVALGLIHQLKRFIFKFLLP